MEEDSRERGDSRAWRDEERDERGRWMHSGRDEELGPRSFQMMDEDDRFDNRPRASFRGGRMDRRDDGGEAYQDRSRGQNYSSRGDRGEDEDTWQERGRGFSARGFEDEEEDFDERREMNRSGGRGDREDYDRRHRPYSRRAS